MKRKILLLSLLGAAIAAGIGGYLHLTRFEIRREVLVLHDASRNRDVPVELAISRRAELRKIFGFKPQVAIVNHGNTVPYSQYRFLGDVLAAQGYLVASIQHDMPGDPPLSMKGYPYLGRLPSYEKAEKNIIFAIGEIRKRYPKPDFSRVTMLGHSQGGDITVFFANNHPEIVSRVVTLDNIRVPLLMSAKAKVLSVRSGNFKPDSGVVPTDDVCEDEGIQVVNTEFQHDHFTDHGPDAVKSKVRDVLARFLADDKPKQHKPPRFRPIDDKWTVNYSPAQ